MRRLGALLLCAVLLIAACGKKSAPRIVMPKKPGAPANVTAIRRPGEVVLAWEKRGSAVRYEVTRMAPDGTVKSAQSVEPQYTDSAQAQADGYLYLVVSVSDEGMYSDYSAPLEVGAMPTLAAPAPFSSAITNEGVRLSWGGAGAFNLYRELVNSPFDTDPYAERIANTTYDDKPSLSAPVKYELRAVQYALANAVRYEGPASAGIVVAPSDYVPSVTKGLKALRKDDIVVLMWDENPEQWITGYDVLRGDELWSGDSAVIGSSWPPAYTDHSAPSGETSYRVRAVGPGGPGPLSEIVRVSAAPLPDAPTSAAAPITNSPDAPPAR